MDKWTKTFNLFDKYPQEKIQLRSHHGEILWEGFPVDGEIKAEVIGIVHSITLPDGAAIYEFPQALVCDNAKTLRFRPDMKVSNF